MSTPWQLALGYDTPTTVATAAGRISLPDPTFLDIGSGNPGQVLTSFGGTDLGWAAVSATGTDAPSDGGVYGRRNAAWAKALPLAGGNMLGVLTLSGPPVAPLDAASKAYVDASTFVDAPNDGSAYGRLSLAWGKVLPLAGGTLTGLLTLSGPPILPLHAATKAYVDGAPNQAVTLSGDISGTGTAAIVTTLTNTAVAPGSYVNTSLTVDGKGRITAASNGGVLAAAVMPAYTGDVTSPAGSTVNTLPNVNANSGTFQGLTLNAKGQVTAAVNLFYLTGNQTITLSGDATGSGTTAIPLTLATVPVAKGGTGATTAAAAATNLAVLPLIGGVLTGGLTLAPTSGWSILALQKSASGFGCQVNSYTGANSRWGLTLGDSTAESGSNAGSNFVLARFNDAGSYIDSPLTIARSTGIATFGYPIVNGSDRSLKSEIVPVTDALAIVTKLQGVYYKYRDTERRQIGLVAQDVLPVLPEVVFETGKPYASDGKSIIEDADPLLGISYPNIVAVLIEAVKELSARLDAKVLN